MHTHITIEIITHRLLHGLWIIPMHRHPNVDEMGINARTGLLQHRI
jgi:hypothetical protein